MQQIAAMDVIDELDGDKVPPWQVVHLPHSVRKAIRTVPLLCERMPSEVTLQWWRAWAAEHLSCRTGVTVVNNTDVKAKPAWIAYLTDPLGFIQKVARSSPHLCVGGDAGGGTLKLGVTYQSAAGLQTFASFLVVEGSDHPADQILLDNTDLVWTGLTADLLPPGKNSIYDVLQCLLDDRSRPCFLHGDWSFLNTVLGLQSASGRHCCPICTTDLPHKQKQLPACAGLRNPLAAHTT